MDTETREQLRLEQEARCVRLGTLGDRNGVNVAKVEVCWWFMDDHRVRSQHAGHFLVHATGDEPVPTIYDTFETLVHEAMQARQERLGFEGYEITDTYAA